MQENSSSDNSTANALRAIRRIVFHHKGKAILVTICLAGVATFALFRQVQTRASRELAEQRAKLENQDVIPYEKILYSPLATSSIQIWQNYRTTRAIAAFRDHLFFATSGGLVELTTKGDLVKHYSTLDGLPES